MTVRKKKVAPALETAERMLAETELCCAVKGGPSDEICWKHTYEGWVMVRGKWGMRPDHLRVFECGCVDTTLENNKLVKCATHKIGPMACCPKAKTIPCVCMYSYSCPDHGNQHIGTHD